LAVDDTALGCSDAKVPSDAAAPLQVVAADGVLCGSADGGAAARKAALVLEMPPPAPAMELGLNA